MRASRNTLPDTLSPAEIAAAGLPALWAHQWPFIMRGDGKYPCAACEEPIKVRTWATTVVVDEGQLRIAHLRHYVLTSVK